MNSKLKATTLTLAVLSLGVCFQQFAFAYDPKEFPGKGNKDDFLKSWEISRQGAVLQRQGKKRESLEFFKKAVETYPYAATFHYNLGLTYSRLNDYRSALGCYQNALKLAPDFVEAYSNISDTQFQLGDFKSAEQTALKATNLNEKSPVAWINLAQAELALSKAHLAKQHLQIAKALPNAEKYAADFQELNLKLQRNHPKTAEN